MGTEKFSFTSCSIYSTNLKRTITKLGVMWRYLFHRYKLSAEEKDFIRLNTPRWSSITDAQVRVLVEGFLYTPASIVDKCVIAKGLEEKHSCRSLIACRGFWQRPCNVVATYKSFAIDTFYYWWSNYLNPLILLKCLSMTLASIAKLRTPTDLLELEYHGIKIGDLIYDSIIRTYPGTFTVSHIGRKAFVQIFRAFYNVLINERLFARFPIKYVVTSHKVYIEYGVMCRVANKYGAAIYVKDGRDFSIYSSMSDINRHRLRIDAADVDAALNQKDELVLAEQFLASRLTGSLQQIDVKNAYLHKSSYTRSSLAKLLKMEAHKYTVFVVAHAFSDSPHASEFLAYPDYYLWLIDTLSVLDKVKDINVCVKAHPSAIMWGEQGAVRKLLQDIGGNNFHLLPENYNMASTKDIADCIVTAQGTAALEYSCFGIPAIICGGAFYSQMGITHEYSQVADYRDALKNITSFKKLPSSVQQRAKIIFYLASKKSFYADYLPKTSILPHDRYEEKYRAQYQEMCNNWAKGLAPGKAVRQNLA